MKSKFILLLIFVAAFFLRTYRLNDTVTFLKDQAYNSIKIRNILKTSILQPKYYSNFVTGPVTHIKKFHLGPAYYYILAPAFYIFNLKPIAGTYVIIFFGLAAIFIIYLFAKTIWGETAGLISAFLYSIAYVPVHTSRLMWNPNLLHFFSITIFYCIYKIIHNDKKYVYLLAFLTGIFVQLHVTSFFIFPILIIVFLIYRIKLTKKRFLISILIFAIIISPLFFNELRHCIKGRYTFTNTYNFIRYIIKFEQVIKTAEPSKPYPVEIAGHISSILFAKDNNKIFVFFLIIFLIFFFLKNNVNDKPSFIIILYPLLFFCFLPTAKGPKPLYLILSTMPFLFMIFAFFISSIFKKNKALKGVIIFFLIFYSYIHISAINKKIKIEAAQKKPPYGPNLKNKTDIIDFILKDTGNLPFTYTEVPALAYHRFSYDYLFLIKNRLPWHIYKLNPFNFINYEYLTILHKSSKIKVPLKYNHYFICFPAGEKNSTINKNEMKKAVPLTKIGRTSIFKRYGDGSLITHLTK